MSESVDSKCLRLPTLILNIVYISICLNEPLESPADKGQINRKRKGAQS